MGIFGRIVRRFLFFFSGSRSGMAGHDPDLDPDREYLIILHRELEGSEALIAEMRRCNQPAGRPVMTPARDITALHRITGREITLPDTRILPLDDMQEIVMAEIGQES
jgi:hypothetical protein